MLLSCQFRQRYLRVGILDEVNFSEHMTARWQLSLFYIDIDQVSYFTLSLRRNLAYNFYSGRLSYSNLAWTSTIKTEESCHFPQYVQISKFLHDATAPSGPGSPHCRGFTITFRYATFVKVLWKSDQPVAETFNWQHTTDKYPCPRRTSNPQSQKASGIRRTP
jgi:hypothetical protein